MGDPASSEPMKIVDGGDVRIIVGDDLRPEKILIAGDSRVELSGALDRLEIEVLGSKLDASGLAVDDLAVMLEQCQVVATAARALSGWVVYGSTITVAADADVDALRTANAGRIIRA